MISVSEDRCRRMNALDIIGKILDMQLIDNPFSAVPGRPVRLKSRRIRPGEIRRACTACTMIIWWRSKGRKCVLRIPMPWAAAATEPIILPLISCLIHRAIIKKGQQMDMRDSQLFQIFHADDIAAGRAMVDNFIADSVLPPLTIPGSSS